MLEQVSKQQALELFKNGKTSQVKAVNKKSGFFARFEGCAYDTCHSEISPLDGRKWEFYVDYQ